MRVKPLQMRRSARHGRSVTSRSLMLATCLLTLSGCASKQPMLSVDCPQPAQVPATLKESSLPDARTLSSEAQSWFDEVSTFLSGLR